MSNTYSQIHPNVASGILEMLDEKGHLELRLHKLVYIAKVHPNENDVTEVALVKVEFYDFASDAEAFRQKFMDNVPELYPILFVISYGPIQPDIPEDGMLQVKLGPREIAED